MNAKYLLGLYTDWFKEEAYITPANSGYTSVAVPLLDRFNDYLQVFVKENGGQIEITDGGAIISNLVMCGMDVSREKCKEEKYRENYP